MAGLFASFHGRLRTKSPVHFLLFILPLLLYICVLSFSLETEWFPIDDQEELKYIRNLQTPLETLGIDAFGLFRPVKNILFVLFSRMSDFGIFPCRIVGIFIGVLSYFPIFGLCRRILQSQWKALLATSIWLLSPTLVSSAVWLSCLNILIMVAFSATTIVCHDQAWNRDSFRPMQVLLAAVFLLLALLSYECAISVLPTLILFDLLLRPGRSQTRHARMSYACYSSIVVFYLILRHLATAKTSMSGSWCHAERWQLAVSSPWFTVQHFTSWFWPFGRFTVMGSYDWGDAPFYLLAICAFAGISILILVLLCRKIVPVFSFCVLFSIFCFAPVSNCLGFGNGPYGDYYLSLASLGLAAGSVELLDRALRVRSSWRAPALLAAGLYVTTRACAVFESAHWARLWADPKSAFETSVRNFPKFVSNKVGMIRYVSIDGRFEEALQLGREIESAIGRDSKNSAGVHLVRAIHALVVLRDADKALQSLDDCEACQSRELSPRFLNYFRGCVFEDLLLDASEAKRLYASALENGWGVDLVPCADRLARLDALDGNLDAAIDLWRKAMELDPDNLSVLWNLAVAYRDSGNEEQRRVVLERVLKLSEFSAHGLKQSAD